MKTILLLILFFTVSLFSSGQTETFSTGSYIINMGATKPNTIANGLKPYGLIYDLLRNNNVPIKWVIAAGKIKDGVDFTYNAVQYKGGTFIIPAEYRSAAVNIKITSWIGQGVVGTTTTSPLTVTVTQTLLAAPRWTLDAANGDIAQGYLTNAGITLVAFPGAYNWKSPQTLGSCDDFFVMPHADPTWATHSNLFFWNKNSLGSIWAGCHAVSALENSINPSNSAQQMNFLSTRTAATSPAPWPNNSLTLWRSHVGGSIPYTHQFFDDPVAQYLGTTDAAHLNGSEQIFLPKQDLTPNNTRWNPGAKIIAYDPTQANVTSPDLANGNIAALIVYGRGFDDPTRGFVMYEAGHRLNKGTAGDVAAQRAFLNFSFFQAQFKAPNITLSGITAGQNINGGTIVSVSASATSPLTGVTFTYLWSCSCGGSFANATATSTTFTAPTVVSPTPCVITCQVTDNCGRASFKSYPVNILPGPQPPVANPDATSISVTCGTGIPVTTNVLSNDTDPGGLLLTLTNVTGVVNGSVSFTAAGNVTFTPDVNFTGPLVLTYTVCNNASPAPLCSNSTLTITTTGGSTPAAANDAFTIAEDAIGTFNVLANDAAGLTVIGITSGPANGRVSINTDNTITYLPNADYAGTDNFTYRVTNGTGGYNIATVTVTVINDACNSGTYQSAPAGSGSVTITADNTNSKDNYQDNNGPAERSKNFGTCTTIDVEGENNKESRGLLQFNDLSAIPSGATITSATLRLNMQFSEANTRTIDIHEATAAWTEGSDCNANGTPNWNTTFKVGTPTFNATALDSRSINTTIGDKDWTSTSLATLVEGWKTTPANNFGLVIKDITEDGSSASLKQFASSENGTAANRPRLLVDYTTPATCAAIPTRAPLAMPDTASTPNGVAVNIATATNDYYPVAGARTYSIVTPPVSGIASINVSTGEITYTPSTTFNGVRSLTYQVTHTGSGLSDIATVYINITNGPIVANNDTPAGALSGTVQTINVRANDTDPEIASLNNTYPVSIVTQPANGTATVDGSGNVVYTPNAGFTGTDVITYQVCEPPPACGSSLCATATITVTVQNRVPTATPDSKTILSCFSNTIDLLSNDTDPENGTLTVTNLSGLTPGTAGTLVNNNDGTVTYTPSAGFLGVFTFTYTVTDNGVTPEVSAAATVTITVFNPPNTAPIPVNDIENTNMDQVLYASVRDNDSDPEDQPLTMPTITVAPLHGTAVVNPFNGQIEYTPNPGYYGTDVLTYSICDILVTNPATCSQAPGLCATATLSITVDAPKIIITLPVKLTAFNANLDQQQPKVNLTWTTATEINASHFVVERSTDGNIFTEVGMVFAFGNTTGQKNYQLSDNISSLNVPVIYYRLRQVDIDGKAEYSATRIVKISKETANTITILTYPNPVSNELSITIPANWQNKKVTYELFNTNGQSSKKTEIDNSSQTENLNVSSLARGLYFVIVKCNGQSAQQKIVKH